jgi:hypothetical protein
MKWNEVEFSSIEVTTTVRDRVKFTYDGGKPFRFQIPRGACPYGMNAWKSMAVQQGAEFCAWWRTLEEHLAGALDPFNSNMSATGALRVKVSEQTNVFDAERQIIFPAIDEGLFRNQDVSCQIEIDGRYFYNDQHGLVVKCVQVMFWGEEVTSCSFLDD